MDWLKGKIEPLIEGETTRANTFMMFAISLCEGPVPACGQVELLVHRLPRLLNFNLAVCRRLLLPDGLSRAG